MGADYLAPIGIRFLDRQNHIHHKFILSDCKLMSFHNLKYLKVNFRMKMCPNMLFKNGIIVPDLHIVSILFAHLCAGELKCLAGTNMDLQVPRALDHILSATGGIDHNYCINHSTQGGLIFVAR
jgi:hypothetical protein